MAAAEPRRWQVLGGGDKGGLLVRKNFSIHSAELPDRLETGAVVEEVRREDNRLRYRLLRGNGPPEGWITVRLKKEERELLIEWTSPQENSAGVTSLQGSTETILERKCHVDSGGAVTAPQATEAPADAPTQTPLSTSDDLDDLAVSVYPHGKLSMAGVYWYGADEFFEILPCDAEREEEEFFQYVKYGVLSGFLWEGDVPDKWHVDVRLGGADGSATPQWSKPHALAGFYTLVNLGDGKLEVQPPQGSARVATRTENFMFFNSQRGSTWPAQPVRDSGHRPTLLPGDAMEHRYVFAPGQADAAFPLFGMTAGLLPMKGPPSNAAAIAHKYNCQLIGNFWDPFDANIASGGSYLAAWKATPVPNRMHAMSTVRGKGGKGMGKTSKMPHIGGAARGRGLLAMPPWHTEWRKYEGKAFFKDRIRSVVGCNRKLGLDALATTREIHTQMERPLLSIICVRWFNYWLDTVPSDYNVLSDSYMTDLFIGPGSVAETDKLHGKYEIWSIFVRGSEDLMRLMPHIHSIRACMRGINVVAWYLIWPTCKDNASGTEFAAGGFVQDKTFFTFMRAMEAASIRTGWPHDAHVYRQLCGKLWIPKMCLLDNGEDCFHVAATTTLSFHELRRDRELAASRAISRLAKIIKRGGGADRQVDEHLFKGVVKLGLSWGGLDVMPFQGPQGLVAAATRILEGRECTSVTCLVQEMIENVIAEHRVLCFHDRRNGRFVKEGVWVLGFKPDMEANGVTPVTGFKLASSKVCNSPVSLFDGDGLAVTQAERLALTLVDRWLTWFCAQSPEPPQNVRFDFLVTHPARGQARVWTCEVGECGASLCSIEPITRNIVALNTAVAVGGEALGFPLPLPGAPLPKNSGYKS
mmetsp:Transcript_35715/g.65547  ORF Transcript_35715/g.65547 Transcript_35715/m.65547 type:complete len:867 (+) Transcript_35715:66-2666(+)